MTANEIINIAVVFDGNKMDMYINNNLRASNNLGTETYVAPQNNTIMTLGAEPSGNAAKENYTEMDLYSCRIYNRALSKEEMTNNYELDKERFMK